MRYLIVIEKAAHNYAAYSPDVPGCVATGKTAAEAEEKMKSALVMHLRGLLEDGLPLPEPTTTDAYVEIEVKSFSA